MKNTFKHPNRLVRLAAATAVCLGLFAGATFGQTAPKGPDGEAITQPFIIGVYVSKLSPPEITISGLNFGATPDARLDFNPLQVISSAPNRIVAQLPANLPVSTRTVTVTDPAAQGPKTAYFSVSIGSVGPQGPQGFQGPRGPAGPVGLQGLKGLVGDRGPAGLVGPQGPKGVVGDRGPAGPVGPQGPKGVVGDRGPAGPVGPQGPKGVIGDRGPTGPVGAQGLRGPQGIQGFAGPVGARGPAGAQGPAGPEGLGPWGRYTFVCPAGNICYTSVACNPGFVLANGGCGYANVDVNGQYIQVDYSGPDAADDKLWRCNVTNFASFGITISYQGYCRSVSFGPQTESDPIPGADMGGTSIALSR